MRSVIRIAELNIAVNHLYDEPLIFSDMFLSDGRETDFEVTVTQEDIEYERRKTFEEYTLEGFEHIPMFSEVELEYTAILRKIAENITDYGGIVFHGSAVAVDGKAYIFTAKSGTGKTTHTRLWLENIPGTTVVNGDKPIIRMIDGNPYVCGTPWNGKEHLGENKCVPLDSIVILTRSKNNSITEVPFRDISTLIIQQTYRSSDSLKVLKTLNILNEIGKCIRFFELGCNMEPDAAFVSYGGLTK